MQRFIDSVANKYFALDMFNENERAVFCELRYIAANIYLHVEYIKFESILEGVILANKTNLPHYLERAQTAIKSYLIRYDATPYSFTILPESYFNKGEN